MVAVRARTWLAALVMAPLAITACGSDEEKAADTGRFCELAQAYGDATSNVDTADPAAFVASLDAAAGAAQEMADAAPADLADDASALASAASDLVERVREVDGGTMDDLLATMQEAADDLQAEYGTLDPETEAIVAEVEETCGFTLSG